MPSRKTFNSCADCVVVGMTTQHCTVCHQNFRSTTGGDLHRIGEYDDPVDPRRCRSADEMRKMGYRQDEHDRWYKPLTAKQRAQFTVIEQRIAETNSNTPTG